MNNNSIGIFDSGLGGLSVFREVYAALPEESIIYYGDGLNCPYGSRAEEEVTLFTLNALEFFMKKGVKLVVVACNTATATAIDLVRAKYDIPIVGMVPAVKQAALTTQSGIVAILATERALEGKKLQQYKGEYAYGLEVISAVGHGFVELVENDLENTPQARRLVEEIIEPLIKRGVDRLVLGCTHYPFLIDVIEDVIGGRNVTVIDPALAIARRVIQLLDEHNIAADAGSEPSYQFFTLADENYRAKMIRKSGISLDKVL